MWVPAIYTTTRGRLQYCELRLAFDRNFITYLKRFMQHGRCVFESKHNNIQQQHDSTTTASDVIFGNRRVGGHLLPVTLLIAVRCV